MKAINMNLKNTVSEACITVGNLYESERDAYDGKNFFGNNIASAWETVRQADRDSKKSRWMI